MFSIIKLNSKIKLKQYIYEKHNRILTKTNILYKSYIKNDRLMNIQVRIVIKYICFNIF